MFSLHALLLDVERVAMTSASPRFLPHPSPGQHSLPHRLPASQPPPPVPAPPPPLTSPLPILVVCPMHHLEKARL